MIATEERSVAEPLTTVGTDSTPSLNFSGKSGTRWNASLPDECSAVRPFLCRTVTTQAARSGRMAT